MVNFINLNASISNICKIELSLKGVMPISAWFALKFIPGGFGTFGCMLNSFIHFLMYFYYFLSAFGPRFQKYLWWKKYLTTMQMVFLIILNYVSNKFKLNFSFLNSYNFSPSLFIHHNYCSLNAITQKVLLLG